MGTPIQKVGESLGIPGHVTDKIIEEVKVNSAKLAKCPRPHDFSVCLDRYTRKPIPNPTAAQMFGAKWGCSKCGGYVDAINRLWYNYGLKDAKSATPA